MTDRPLDVDELDRLREAFDGWLGELTGPDSPVEEIGRDLGDPSRWYVRVAGEERDHVTIWFTLGQRHLRFESWFLPPPRQDSEALMRFLMEVNGRVWGLHFGLGEEEAVFLRGERRSRDLDPGEVDEVIGMVVATVERYFRAALGRARW